MENGAEVVEAVKASRGKEGIIYKLFAKTFLPYDEEQLGY